MKQCQNCQNYAAENVGRCGPLEVDAPPDETIPCLPFEDGIPVEYWEDKEKCPYFMEK